MDGQNADRHEIPSIFAAPNRVQDLPKNENDPGKIALCISIILFLTFDKKI